MLAYTKFDFIVCYFLYGGSTDLDMQMYFHHVAAIMSIFASYLHGYGLVNAASIGFLMEGSTFFLNYRGMLTEREQEGTPGLIANLLFFFSYTIFRVILVPYNLIRIYRTV